MGLVAAMIILAGLLTIAYVAKTVWENLLPILQFQLLMQITALKIDMKENGYKIPNWLEDAEEENAESAQVVRLVPKDKSE